jgi:DNA-binding protein HU-beta
MTMMHGKHVAEPASAEEIRRSLGVTAQEWNEARRIMLALGYLRREENNTDLIGSVADSVEGLTREKARQVVDAVFAAITDAVKAGESAKVPGFGSFSLSERASRQGRNPVTGSSTPIRASRSVRFRPGKELKESLNSKRRLK